MNIVPVSGGGGLNFRVIGGTTAPTSPKENDIWVNTNVKITNWKFSSEEPFIRTENVDCVIAKEKTRLDSTGTEGYFPQANLTDYIKLPDGTTKITTNNCDTVTSTMCHAFYTADKTLISTVLRKEGTTTFGVPSNAAYVRLSMFDNAPVNSDPLSFVATIGVESGFVWIYTGTKSGVAFNALKKNNITVYPISAKQYVSGVWADNAKIYQNGAWVEFVNREVYISDGVMLSEPTSVHNATIEESGGVCKINTVGSRKWAVNFECNNHAGQTAYIEIASGKALNTSNYTSGILVNTVEADATDSTPDYIAQTLITDTVTNTIYELKIPNDFNSGYLTVHVEPNASNGYYNIKNLWIE